MTWNNAVCATLRALALGAAVAASVAAQEPRPKGVPFYTWVREDTFAGFMADDLTRFERGMAKAQEYRTEDATNMDALNWLGAGNIYRAVRAYAAGDQANGDRLFRDGMAMMDKAIATQPTNAGIRATHGGTLMLFAGRLPDRHYDAAIAKARESYAALYKAQAPALDKFPLHLKGEALAGVAETEFRGGNRETATTFLERIVADMPNTGYARVAASWLKAPEAVTKTSRLVCQSCHEPGRLSARKG
jgi:hypothetical protein